MHRWSNYDVSVDCFMSHVGEHARSQLGWGTDWCIRATIQFPWDNLLQATLKYMTKIGQQLRWRHNGCGGVSNTSFTIVDSTVYSDAGQRKHQSSASLAFVLGIHRGPVNSPHKGPVTRKIFPFDDVIMNPLTTTRHNKARNVYMIIGVCCSIDVSDEQCL